MLSNPSHIHCSVSSLNQVNAPASPTPLERDLGLGHGLEQVHEDHDYVIHDMAFAEASPAVDILVGNGTDILKMVQDLEDLLSPLSDSRLGKDSSKTATELSDTASIPDLPSRDIGSVTCLSYPLEQAFLGGAIDGRPQEMPVAIEGKTSKLHQVHPWHPAELVSSPAETSWMKEPGWRQARGAHELDVAGRAEGDRWSIQTLLGDLDEDREWEFLSAEETVQTL